MFISFLVGILLIAQSNGVYLIENEPFLKFTQEQREYEEPAPQRVNPENVGVKISADKYFVLDVESGKVLVEQNANVPQAIASITKLMTAVVILDQNPNWSKSVFLQERDETVGAYPKIYRGEQVLFRDLWKSGLIASDNNSIMAMVRALGFSRAEFVELMNQKAQELELYNTSFADPTGLDEYNLSTATDVAKLIYHTMQHNEIKEAVIEGTYTFEIQNTGKDRKIFATDILIDSFLNSPKYNYELIGGKTGFLNEAGYCLAVQIAHHDNPVIIVVLNSETIESRFQDTKVLADWVFTNYSW